MRTQYLFLILLLVGVLFGAIDANATAILAFRSPSRVVLAADSLLYANPPSKVCKIKPAGRWWTLHGGVMRIDHPTLDVQALVLEAIAPATTLADVGRVLHDRLYSLLVASLRDAGTALRRYGSEPCDSLLNIVVAGSDRHDPKLRVGVFVIDVKTIEPPTFQTAWTECPGAWCDSSDGQSVYYAASLSGPAVDRVVERPLLPWVKNGDGAAARRLVTEQIAATPAFVSAPIDVLEITKAGAHWFSDADSLCSGRQ